MITERRTRLFGRLSVPVRRSVQHPLSGHSGVSGRTKGRGVGWIISSYHVVSTLFTIQVAMQHDRKCVLSSPVRTRKILCEYSNSRFSLYIYYVYILNYLHRYLNCCFPIILHTAYFILNNILWTMHNNNRINIICVFRINVKSSSQMSNVFFVTIHRYLQFCYIYILTETI